MGEPADVAEQLAAVTRNLDEFRQGAHNNTKQVAAMVLAFSHMDGRMTAQCEATANCMTAIEGLNAGM
eukprot:15470849-Alexandrium_andersonii.AAC.1